MKIQLDTNTKTIKVEETVNLGELIELLKKMLPNGEWKDFGLDTQTTINWTPNPIQPYQPVYPWWDQPWITYQTTDGTSNVESEPPVLYSINSGVYNIES